MPSENKPRPKTGSMYPNVKGNVGRGAAPTPKKRTPPVGSPRPGAIKPSSMYAKGTKCKSCGKSMSSCKC